MLDIKYVTNKIEQAAFDRNKGSKLYLVRLYGRNKTAEEREAIENAIKEQMELDKEMLVDDEDN